jgi:hypothetical protein
VKAVKLGLLLALALTTGPAIADEDVGIGPWRLGMSKEQVTALAEQGPYKDIAGGVEAEAGKFQGNKAGAALTFGDAGLRSIQVKVYEGDDWRKAETAALSVFDYFKSNYGGANVKDVANNPDRDALDQILRQTLGTAEPLNDNYAKNGSHILMVFDMMPLKQPAESRLHCQWTFDGKTKRYAVYLYQDQPKAPKRDVEESVEIKKL